MSWPILQSQFFTKHPPSTDFFKSFATQFLWTEEIMPIYEWQGLVYVATSAPGTYAGRADWPTHWVLIEASPTDLQNTWMTFQSGAEPSIMLRAEPSIHVPHPSGSFSPDDLLAGLGEQTHHEEASSQPEEGHVSFSDDDGPPGLNLSEHASPSPMSLRKNPASPARSPEQIAPPTAPPPPPRGPPTVAAPTPLRKTTPSAQPTPAKGLPAPISKPGMGQVKTPTAEFAKLASELEDIPSLYHTVLLASKAGNSVRIALWPETLNGGSTEYDFSLGTPSPFRICLRTEKSYHGYIVETPFLSQFFKHWNGGTNPETMTVSPVARDGAVVGFVVALGGAEAHDGETLLSVEKTAAKLGKIWPVSSDAKAS